MAWSIISSATGTNTATLGTHAAGDLILVFAYRDGSTTAPSLVSGFTNVVNGGANTNSARCAFKIAASSSETIGTWTNATSVIVVVIRNGMVGAYVQGGASSTTFNYPALTFLENDGTSGVLGFIATRDGSSPASVDTAPSGMTYLNSVKDATDSAGLHYDLLATGWSSTNVATGVAATGWRSIVVEILDQELPANYFGYDTIGGSEAGVNVDTTQAGSKFTVPEDCTIDEIWVYAKHFDASGLGKTCIYSDSSGVPLDVLDNGDTFNYNQFYAWRKSKGLAYSATTNEELHPSVAYNDTWYMRYDSGGTNQTYDKQNFAYASAFEDPSTSTDRSQANIVLSMIVVYTPTSGGLTQDNSDTLTLSDDEVIVINKSLSDSLSLADSISFSISKSLSDTLTLSDSISKSFSIPLSDSIALSDSESIVKAITESLSDTLNLSDAESKVFGKSLSDSISLSDIEIKSISLSQSDSLTLTDSLTKSISLAISDIINLSDSLSKYIETTLDDTITLADSETITVAKLISLSDSITLSDNSVSSLALLLSDALILSDDKSISLSILLGDSFAISDAMSQGHSIILSDSMSLTDLAIVAAGLAKLRYEINYLFEKNTIGIDYDFMKNTHNIDYEFIKNNYSINYTFNKDTNSIDYTFEKNTNNIDTN